MAGTNLPEVGDAINVEHDGQTLVAIVQVVTPYRIAVVATLDNGKERTLSRPHSSDVWEWEYSR